MSETSEQQVTTRETGRCEKAAHEVAHSSWNQRFNESLLQMATAATIDRLAADVASIKEAVCGRSGWPVGWLIEVDRLIRLRDEARVEVKRLQEELDDREQTEQVERMREENEILHRASLNYIHDRDQYRRKRDEARAEVERLKNKLYDREQEILSLRDDTVERYEPPAAPQPAGQGISPGLSDTQPTQNAAPAPGWLTDEERHILGAHLQSLRDQRRAMERGGQTLGYSADPCGLKREADVIDNLLARAGSPPVVEVPEEKPGLGHLLHRIYRDAISRAGISWKEVPRE